MSRILSRAVNRQRIFFSLPFPLSRALQKATLPSTSPSRFICVCLGLPAPFSHLLSLLGRVVAIECVKAHPIRVWRQGPPSFPVSSSLLLHRRRTDLIRLDANNARKAILPPRLAGYVWYAVRWWWWRAVPQTRKTLKTFVGWKKGLYWKMNKVIRFISLQKKSTSSPRTPSRSVTRKPSPHGERREKDLVGEGRESGRKEEMLHTVASHPER